MDPFLIEQSDRPAVLNMATNLFRKECRAVKECETTGYTPISYGCAELRQDNSDIVRICQEMENWIAWLSIYVGSELILIDRLSYLFYEVQLVLSSWTPSAGTFTAEVYDVATCHLPPTARTKDWTSPIPSDSLTRSIAISTKNSTILIGLPSIYVLKWIASKGTLRRHIRSAGIFLPGTQGRILIISGSYESGRIFLWQMQ